ncbi:hypothetical protein, partial [Allokutzneria sp. NRRL B-24872]|uniref:hypothetical protein n=1 Tax=Allokutzneria sp. NRRL B-24872 TaxID=1137961 RepID=UPI00117768AC
MNRNVAVSPGAMPPGLVHVALAHSITEREPMGAKRGAGLPTVTPGGRFSFTVTGSEGFSPLLATVMPISCGGPPG